MEQLRQTGLVWEDGVVVSGKKMKVDLLVVAHLSLTQALDYGICHGPLPHLQLHPRTTLLIALTTCSQPEHLAGSALVRVGRRPACVHSAGAEPEATRKRVRLVEGTESAAGLNG